MKVRPINPLVPRNMRLEVHVETARISGGKAVTGRRTGDMQERGGGNGDGGVDKQSPRRPPSHGTIIYEDKTSAKRPCVAACMAWPCPPVQEQKTIRECVESAANDGRFGDNLAVAPARGEGHRGLAMGQRGRGEGRKRRRRCWQPTSDAYICTSTTRDTVGRR
jgi:hypothetical protein